eukprot:jgi/Galph1/2979/GphlegSOOS_G1640.1
MSQEENETVLDCRLFFFTITNQYAIPIKFLTSRDDPVALESISATLFDWIKQNVSTLLSFGTKEVDFPASITVNQQFKVTIWVEEHDMEGLSGVWGLNNGLARTPPMGYDTWNFYHCRYDGETLMKTTKAMKDAGILELEGRLQPNPFKFPHEIKSVIDYICLLGLKFGIYNCVGTRTCAGFPGCYGHYDECAQQYAEWGEFPGWSHEQVAKRLYSEFRDALNATGRPIIFSMCNGWDADDHTMDIADNYDVMRDCYEQNILHSDSTGSGHWNNPDMLEVGNGGMTTTEYITHFTPLVVGTNVINMTQNIRMILTNKEVIDVDQDVRKPLANGDVAIVLFDSNGPGVINTTLEQVLLKPNHDVYILCDLWSKEETTIHHFISAYVESHVVKMYRIHSGKAQDAPPHHVIFWNPSPMMLTESPKRYGAFLRIENVGASVTQQVKVELKNI